ncbi:hypothetical protein Deipe_3213 [Deinococcus peraridilitoris DSM 19664]|uniref:Uncharacterized protein n=2 Tax=Deinococcus TaxID=1298 RepID=L0A495_DEIPD|nr:hypothetical protein Deipe_3213 [Deinococcus peraridilitoris DSM 19664]
MPNSDLNCPAGRHGQAANAPLDACVYFYECEPCQEVHKPLTGNCCVFCSYGSSTPPSRARRSQYHP